MATKLTPYLYHIPLVILRIILEELHETDRTAFFNFRIVSKICRNESEYLLFRNISIHDHNAFAQSQSSKMVERLKNSNGSAVEYVRHLKIGPIRNEDWLQSEIIPALGEVLRSIDNLSDLTWHMNCAPSPSFLHLFHEMHPLARLHLLLRDRKFEPLTRDLLASPQLYTLDTEIYRTLPGSTGHSLSELSFIKSNLASSTRVLRISARGVHADPQRAQFEEWGSVTNSVYNLDFQPGDRFPALSEMALEHDEFFLTEEHCSLWARATSWEQLQRLDLNKGAPRYFLASLINRATNLKYLRFYINLPTRNDTWNIYPLESSIAVIEQFVACTTSLHTLDLGGESLECLTHVLRVILQNLRGSLRSLKISWSGYPDTSGPIDFVPGMLGWEPEYYMELLQMAPGLKHLNARMGKDTVLSNWKDDDCYADAGKKWKMSDKKITIRNKEKKKQRSQKTQRLIW
ncbi:hypothetical protein E8E13_000361 [Curvularia kusanoi]|uniref:Uncharacterized protein n=1 Tax=Curvularia kusanoi TaxID=90978 RepID=A0A9P4W7M3_CURKU|nr:hypothetical protein E8E13_000361 [Curvularia kusanoi]